MTFPRYPDYKDSGIEWLGEVPGHWVLKKVKYVASFSGGGTPSRDNMAYWNGDIPWVSPKDMKAEEIQGAEECITDEGLANSTSSLVAPGTVLMVVRSGILKHTIPIAINQVEVALNQDMKALTFQPDLCLPRFFLRWVQGLNDELLLAWAKQGATVESVEQEYLANTAIPLPSLPEQSTIAAFLDRETGKIDALVAEQEKLIELLKEKRQAVISHAVTKGLDPSVPMKDSGIEWLGEVPAHWEVKKLKHLVREGDGIQMGPFGGMLLDLETEDTGFRVYGQQNTISGDFNLGDRWISEARYLELERYRLDPGDIVLTRKGSLGNARLVSACVSPGIIDSDTIRLRLDNAKAKSEYISFLFHKCPYIEEQISLMKRGAILSGINSETIANIIVALPPRDEQDRLDVGIFTKTGVIDTLAAEAQRAIELLKEHRSALISAAVTGKIDVRGLVPAPEEAA